MEEKNLDCCSESELHEEEINAAQKSLPDEAKLMELADFYKIFGDFSRIKLLYLLDGRELCVCDITKLMNINQSAVSNHLALLRRSKLVKLRKEGKNTYYSLSDYHVEAILKQGMEHINE